MKLIQGFFFQNIQGLALAFDEEEGFGAVIRKALMPFMFAGTIYSDKNGILVGSMLDPQGDAKLYDITLSSKELIFKKQYRRHELLGPERHICYTFDLQEDGTWAGTWDHPASQGSAWGPARCVLSEIDDKTLQRDLRNYVKVLPRATG